MTGIKADRRRAGYVVVEVDGVRLGVLPVDRVRTLALRRGLVLDAVHREQLDAAISAEAAYERAVRLLAARARSVADLRRRLRSKGFSPPAVEEAVAKLEASGLLDDAAFARAYAEVRADRGFAAARVRADLLAAGVARSIAERAIAEAIPSDEDRLVEQMLTLARRRSRQLGILPALTKKRRLLGYLSRRGFGGAKLLEVVERVIGEERG